MTLLNHLKSSKPPALAQVLSVTAYAWGLSDRLPTVRSRARGSAEIKAPLACGMRWAI